MKLNLKKGQKLWFTSDTHYNHGNICSSTTQWTNPVTLREFASLEQMNSHLIANINEKVEQDDDYYYFIGFSGSCYKCHKKGYGISTSYGLGVLNKILEQGEVELMEDIGDWLKFINND